MERDNMTGKFHKLQCTLREVSERTGATVSEVIDAVVPDAGTMERMVLLRQARARGEGLDIDDLLAGYEGHEPQDEDDRFC